MFPLTWIFPATLTVMYITSKIVKVLFVIYSTLASWASKVLHFRLVISKFSTLLMRLEMDLFIQRSFATYYHALSLSRIIITCYHFIVFSWRAHVVPCYGVFSTFYIFACTLNYSNMDYYEPYDRWFWSHGTPLFWNISKSGLFPLQRTSTAGLITSLDVYHSNSVT